MLGRGGGEMWERKGGAGDGALGSGKMKG